MKWPEYPLSRLAERFISGGTPPTKIQEYWQGDIPWITGADFLDGDVSIGRRYISELAVDNSSTNIVPKGSILMVTRTCVGKIAIAPFEIAVSQDITGIVIKSKLSAKYILYAIRNKMAIILAAQRGATIKGVTRKDIEILTIPLAPLSEQHRIVEILDEADALRKKRAEADAKAARILPALFYRMFGDPATNPKGWDTVLLEDVLADTRNGLYKHGDFYGKGSQILKMFNIQSGELDLSRVDRVELAVDEEEKYSLIPGDILINRVNTKELVGKCAVITGDLGPAVFESKNIRARLKPDRATPEFVAHYLNTTFGHAALCQGVKHAIGMATINNTDLRRMAIPRPPLELQNNWDGFVRQVRESRKSRRKVCARLNQLFDVLLHRAFSGDLTAKWREAHMKELLTEMEHQSKALEGNLCRTC